MSKPLVSRPRMNLFEDAGRLTVQELKKLKKKIPRQGLNNMTRAKYLDGFGYGVSEDGSLWSIPPKPTLPRRMSKLLFGLPYLPPQMVTMGAANGTHNEEAKRLLVDCFELLVDLKNNLDDVTVVSKEDIDRYKNRIENLVSYLRWSAKILGLIQEGEFAVCDER